MSNQISVEQNYQVLLDALKYTSDIVVTLTEKNSINENKITYLEKIILEQKNILDKNNTMIIDLGKKITMLEKNIISSINKDKLLIENNVKPNVNLEFLSQSINELNELKEKLISNYTDDIDIETINNTICNATILSEVSSFNIEDIEKFKKQKSATSLVENLIKRKQEIENKINGLASNPSIIIENEKSLDTKDSKNDLNAIRRKKNFAKKF
jgi:hypothetical protein